MGRLSSKKWYTNQTTQIYLPFIRSSHPKHHQQEREADFERSKIKKWSILLHNNKFIPDLPGKASVALFRLPTGHDCIAVHLHRLLIFSHLTSTMDRNLLQCQATAIINSCINSQLTKYYLDTRIEMEEIQEPEISNQPTSKSKCCYILPHIIMKELK
jgi:hypothetical protein